MSKAQAAGKPLVVSRPSQRGQTIEERLTAIEADLAEIKSMLKKALGQ